MTNKECIEKLRDAQDFNKEWLGERFDAVDHAISQLEMLDRLEEWIKQNIDPQLTETIDTDFHKEWCLGYNAGLKDCLDKLTGDNKALKILAEVEE